MSPQSPRPIATALAIAATVLAVATSAGAQGFLGYDFLDRQAHAQRQAELHRLQEQQLQHDAWQQQEAQQRRAAEQWQQAQEQQRRAAEGVQCAAQGRVPSIFGGCF